MCFINFEQISHNAAFSTVESGHVNAGWVVMLVSNLRTSGSWTSRYTKS